MVNKYTYSLPFTKKQLESDYLDGLSQAELAQRYHVSQKVIWRAMKNFDIKARKTMKRSQLGENNSSWKGSKAGYQALHKRVQVLRGRPEKCEVCGTTDATKSYDWANLTGQYDDVQDYKRMCRSCHWKHDETYKNFYVKNKGGMPK